MPNEPDSAIVYAKPQAILHLGVAALQGAVSEHIAILERALKELGLAGDAIPVRRPEQLEGLAGLVLPGGESTTIARLLASSGVGSALQRRVSEGMGLLATCAGAILAATEVDDPTLEPLGLMGMAVERNAFGRQRDSFEAHLTIQGLSKPFRGVFIRAPAIINCREGCRAIISHQGRIVGARQGRLWAFSFHPELAGDTRLHRAFVKSLSEPSNL